MRELALSKVYQLVEPGPVVLVTTTHDGRQNVMTMSWHMMVDFEPPLIACVVSENDFSFAALMAERECVIAIPTSDLASVVVKIGNCSGRTTDKFEEFALTPVRAHLVAPPLIAECFANLECRVVDTSMVAMYNVFVVRVVKSWLDPKRVDPRTLHHHGYGHFVIDGEAIEMPSKMP